MEVTSSLSAEEYEVLRRVVEKIYSLPSSAEFRRPVLLAYPDLATSYLQAISKPMDLGTIMSKLLKKSYKSKQEVSNDIALVFNNSITYNADLTHMVSMSRHLLSYSSLLWSELVDTSFPPDRTTSTALTKSHIRAEERRQRMETIREEYLFMDEVIALRDTLEPLVSIRDASSIPYPACLANCSAHLKNETDSSLTTLTLAEALQPIVFHFRALYFSHSEVSPSDSAEDLSAYPVFLIAELGQDIDNISGTILSSMSLHSSLYALDKFLNVLSVDVLERCCRGNVASSVWAAPGKLVWAQPPKSAWWPGMIIAAGSNVQEDYSFPPLLSAANISRLPGDIVSELMKLRPRGNNQSHIPPKRCIPSTYSNNANLQEALMSPGSGSYVLIEFFGSHDFGWVRPEAMFDFPPDGSLHIPAAKRSSNSSDKGTQDSATLLEARETYEWLQAPPCPRDIFDVSYFESLDVVVPQSILDLRNAVSECSDTPVPPPPKKKSNKKKKAEEVEPRPVSENKRKEACARSKELSRWLQAQQPVLSLSTGRGRAPAVTAVLSEGAPIMPPAPAAQPTEWTPPPAFIFGDTASTKTTPAKASPRPNDKATLAASANVADDIKQWATSEDINFSGTFPVSCSTLVSLRGTETARNCGYSGASVLHCRRVNLRAPLFCLESKSREERKRVLRDEIAKLKDDIQLLQETQQSRKALVSDLESITTEAKQRHEKLSPQRQPVKPKSTPPISRKRNSSKISGIAALKTETVIKVPKLQHVENGNSTPPPKAVANADSTGSDVKSSSSGEVKTCSVIYSSAMSMMPF